MTWNRINPCQRCHPGRCRWDRVFLPLFLLSFLALQAQQSNDLEGRVHSGNGDVSGTHILNVSSNKGTITDGKGFFSIAVKLNDTLVFSAIQLKRKELVVNSSILESKLVNIYLEDGEIRLDEVLVTPYNLTGDLSKDLDSLDIGSIVSASTLGLPNANVKVKTQNERKLFEADNGKFISLPFDSLTLDPTMMINLNKILNRITGRTKNL